MKISRADKIVMVLGLLILSFLGFLLYGEFATPLVSKDGTPQGTITWRYRIAQRKFSSTVVWQSLPQSSPVYNKDTIRTDRASEATILLNDGTSIELDQESMIVLHMERKPHLELKRGSILLKRGKEARKRGPKDGLSIEARNKEFILNEGKARFSDGEDKLNVVAESGHVQFLNNGKFENINRGTLIEFSANGVERNPVSIRLLRPEENRHIFTERGGETIEFIWSAKKRPMEGYLEASRDRAFTRIEKSVRVIGERGKLTLPKGIYYWRVRNLQDSNPVMEVRKISILRKESITPLSPAQGQSFEYKNKPPLIHFTWEGHPSARSYFLEVSTDREFKNIAAQKDVFLRRISLSLKEGSYYWRVTPRGIYENSFQTTAPISFYIKKGKEIFAPVPGLPGEGSQIPAHSLTNEDGATFNWKMDPELTKSRILISEDSSFKQTKIEAEPEENFYILKEPLPAGRYYWKVLGKDRSGTTTPYSKVMSFSIIGTPEGKPSAQSMETSGPPPTVLEGSTPGDEEPQPHTQTEPTIHSPQDSEQKPVPTKPTPGPGPEVVKEPTAPSAPRLLSPATNAVIDMTDSDQINFRWSRPEGKVTSYTFRLYRNDKLLFSKKQSDTGLIFTELSLLDTGKFEWSVTATGASEDLISTERKQSFSITLKEGPAAPTGITTNPVDH